MQSSDLQEQYLQYEPKNTPIFELVELLAEYNVGIDEYKLVYHLIHKHLKNTIIKMVDLASSNYTLSAKMSDLKHRKMRHTKDGCCLMQTKYFMEQFADWCAFIRTKHNVIFNPSLATIYWTPLTRSVIYYFIKQILPSNRSEDYHWFVLTSPDKKTLNFKVWNKDLEPLRQLAYPVPHKPTSTPASLRPPLG